MRPDDRGGSRQPPLPKPYAFVPFPEGRSDLRRPYGHDRYHEGLLTGSIEGTLTALSPVHVASGSIELTGRQPPLVKAHFRCAGRPTIPGSSLKGAIRSIVEAISSQLACVRVTRAQPHTLPRDVRICPDEQRFCLACRMFGAMGYLGRVQFRDAVLNEDRTAIIAIPSLYAPHPRERVYFSGRFVKGRKFYMHGLADGEPARGNVPVEVCPKGSQFGLRVDFVNLSRDELGLLLVALGQGNPPLWPKLGGAKPVCCGSLQVSVESVATVGDLALEFDPRITAQDVKGLVDGNPLVDGDRYEHLCRILRFPGELPPPDRNY